MQPECSAIRHRHPLSQPSTCAVDNDVAFTRANGPVAVLAALQAHASDPATAPRAAAALRLAATHGPPPSLLPPLPTLHPLVACCTARVTANPAFLLPEPFFPRLYACPVLGGRGRTWKKRSPHTSCPTSGHFARTAFRSDSGVWRIGAWHRGTLTPQFVAATPPNWPPSSRPPRPLLSILNGPVSTLPCRTHARHGGRVHPPAPGYCPTDAHRFGLPCRVHLPRHRRR